MKYVKLKQQVAAAIWNETTGKWELEVRILGCTKVNVD